MSTPRRNRRQPLRLSLQEQYASRGVCFGCGLANRKGLRIRSFVHGEEVRAEWMPSREHEAWPGTLSGGIIGALLDCHSNWTAAWHLMKKTRRRRVPSTVTAEYSVKLLRPTPTASPVSLVARVVRSTEKMAEVEASLSSGEQVCASCRGIFIAVVPGHPAYHRW